MTDPITRYLEFMSVFLGSVRGGSVKLIPRPGGRTVCYADGGPAAVTIWEVDVDSGERRRLLDVEKTRRTLEQRFGHPLPFGGLPFADFEFAGPGTIRAAVPRLAAGLINPALTRLISPDADTWIVDIDIESGVVSLVPAAERQRRRLSAPRITRKGHLASDIGTFEVLSPDGRWQLGEQGANLALRSVADDRTHPLTQDGTEENRWRVDGAAWSRDAQKLIASRLDTAANERVYLLHWLQPYDQVESHPFTKVGGALPISQGAIIDVPSRQAIDVELPGEHDQIVAPAGWRHDGGEAYFLTVDRRQHYLRLYAVPAAGGAARLVCEETSETFILGIRALPRFTADLLLPGDERLLWYSERTGWRHLYLYGTDGTEVATITSGEFEVLQVVSVDAGAGLVYFSAHSDPARPYDVHLCVAALDGSGHRQLTSLPGVHSPVPVKVGDDFFFNDSHTDIDRPPASDLLRADGRAVARLSTADVSGLAQLPLNPPEPFTVKAADGTTDLHGVLYRPPGFDPSRKYPVVEDIYGGPQVPVHQVGFADPRGVQSMAKAMLGFVVFTVDGRGTPDRGKAFQDVVYGRFHEFHVEDHRAALEQLLERYPFMDRERIGVTGGSWGGYNTVRSLLLAPDLYRVGVAVCPVYDLVDHAAMAVEPYMGLPVYRPEAFAAGSSIDIAAKLEGKLLMIHGTSDVNATFSATMKMCEALARADKPYDLIVMPDADHHFNNAGLHHLRYGQASTLRYFIEHLRPEIPEVGDFVAASARVAETLVDTIPAEEPVASLVGEDGHS